MDQGRTDVTPERRLVPSQPRSSRPALSGALRVQPPALSHRSKPTKNRPTAAGSISCARSAISSAASRSTGTSGRSGDVFNPNTGEVQAKVALASKAEVEKAIANAAGRAAGLGRDQSAAPRARDVQVPRADPGRVRRPRAAALLRARQDLRRRQGRHPARPRGGRVRLRHPASAEGRVHRGRRPRHRPLFDAPAARRRRRHHAVQLPGHDPAVEVRAGDRLRQRLHPQAVGARSVGADAHRRAVHRGGPAAPACSTSSTATRKRSTRCSTDPRVKAIGFVGSSADRRNTSIRPAARTASACSASAAPRTT